MAAKTYYTGIGDVNVNKDVIAKSPDMHIQFYEFIGTATLTATTVNAHVLTVVGSTTFTVDDLISTSAKNLVLVDDNDVVAQCKIDDNDATTVTFDEATLLLDSDGSTTASLTISTVYDVYFLTPSNQFTVGPFFGLTEGLELNVTDELMQYNYSIPQKRLFQDLKARVGELVGGSVDIMNEDVFDTIMGSSNYGSQTSQWSKGVGSDPDLDRFYRITLLGEDRTSRQYQIILRKCQISVQGSLLGSAESGHKMAGFKFDVLSDGFYPDTDDMIQVIRAD